MFLIFLLEEKMNVNEKNLKNNQKLPSTHHRARKSSINALRSLLPIVQESYRIGRRASSKLTVYNNQASQPIGRYFRNVSVQCDDDQADKNKYSLQLASWLSLPNDAVFLEVQTRRLIEPRSSDQRIRIGSLLRSSSYERTAITTTTTNNNSTTHASTSSSRRVVVYLQEIGVQTCELDNSSTRLVGQLFSAFSTAVKSVEPRALAGLIEKLSYLSRRRLLKCISSSSAPGELCQKLLKMT